MNRKISIIVIAIFVILISILGYATLIKKNSSTPISESQINLQNTKVISKNTEKNINECDGKFIFPKVGDKLTLGEKIQITWLMPKGIDKYYEILSITLLNNRDTKLGNIIHWNWVKYNPITSAQWDVRTLYDSSQLNLNMILEPGKYRLEFSYEISDSHTDTELGNCVRKGIFIGDYFEIQ